MAYKKRIPPIKVDLSIERFNYLIELLSSYENVEDKIGEHSKKLKEKLLRYSIPRTKEEKEIFIDTRFYPNESSFLIEILINNSKEITINANYYEVLLKLREKSQDNE